MKILAIGDTHGNLSYATVAIKDNPDANLIIHLGDFIRDGRSLENMYPEKEFKLVRGNCDFAVSNTSTEEVLEVCGKRILIVHGHTYSVKTGYEKLFESAKFKKIDLALFGHTHVAEEFANGSCLFLNPGSMCTPRNNARKSYATIDIDEDKIKTKIIYIDRVF